MIKKCPDCGSLNVEEVFDNESYCKDCHLHCATADLEDASVFDQITQSPEVLAESLVFWEGGWTSRFIKFTTTNREEAIAATVEELNKLAKLKYEAK